MTENAPHPSRPVEEPAGSLPAAIIKSERRISVAWIIPVLALALAAWLGWRGWSLRGTTITVQLDSGHGLRAGDDVRYRGIVVGSIRGIELSPELDHVIVTAGLHSQAEQIARGGTRFWVVRPQLHLTNVQGLETLIGPRYLAALPASAAEHAAAPRQRHFEGLDEPPVVESVQPGDLEIVLQARQRGSLHPGAPVTYRQTRVGTVLSVGLAGDAGAVEARVHIQQPYVALIRTATRFWDVGGLQAKLGLSGVSIEIESAEALLSGGVALATPAGPDAGEVVRTGHRFELQEKPEDEWLEWEPMVVIGNSMLPPGAAPPSPLRAAIGWTQGRWISREKSRNGWVLQTAEGLLGPADLLKPTTSADQGSAVLEVDGQIIPLDTDLVWERNGLALRRADVTKSVWPNSRTRVPREPEECVAIGDPSAMPLPLAAARLTAAGDGWSIDAAISIDPAWHGACVVGRSDGRLIGLLLVEAGQPRVGLIPAP